MSRCVVCKMPILACDCVIPNCGVDQEYPEWVNGLVFDATVTVEKENMKLHRLLGNMHYALEQSHKASGALLDYLKDLVEE